MRYKGFGILLLVVVKSLAASIWIENKPFATAYTPHSILSNPPPREIIVL